MELRAAELKAAGFKRVVGGLAVGVTLVAVVLGLLQWQAGRYGFIAGWVHDWRHPVGEETALQTNPPPYALMARTMMTDDGAVAVDGSQPGPFAELTIPVVITPPPGAVRMQLADNVGFLGTEWVPVASGATVPVDSAGYQTIFARFELDDGSIGPISVTGAEVDMTFSAATSSADGGRHEPSWIRPFSPTELAIRVEAGRIEKGALEPYDLDNPPPGDSITARGSYSIIDRNGEPYGLTVSNRRDVIRRGDQLIGSPLDATAATADTWTIESTDPGGTTAQTNDAGDDDDPYARPTAVGIRHIARPEGGGQGLDGASVWAVVHDFVITLPRPLTPGYTYTITPAGTIDPVSFTYDPSANTSPAVQVSHVGMGVDDTPKVAYLAGWFDGLGASAVSSFTGTETDTDTGGPALPRFTVVDEDTDDVVFEGTGRERPVGPWSDHAESAVGVELTGSPVFELDFSPVNTAGRYRVCVESVGCSHPFRIADHVWLELADTAARAIYHQRSGVELGPPYTPLHRPRPYHPDDGVSVLRSRYSLLAAQSSTANTDFVELVRRSSGETTVRGVGRAFRRRRLGPAGQPPLLRPHGGHDDRPLSGDVLRSRSQPAGKW